MIHWNSADVKLHLRSYESAIPPHKITQQFELESNLNLVVAKKKNTFVISVIQNINIHQASKRS